jgi:predicted nucleic acid-binding protein
MGKQRGVISNQILVELYNALTRKLGVEVESARVIVESFIISTNWQKVDYNHRTVIAAINISRTFKTPFLDTLIAETAKENGIANILTENVANFANIPGLDIRNPLSK